MKAISRAEEEYVGERPGDVASMPRNPDPAEHPQAAATEYTRALNASKLGRLFAAPLVGSLDGHSDGVTSLARSHTDVHTLATGSADGEIRLWSAPDRRCIASLTSHTGIVRGLSLCAPLSSSLLASCADDCTIRFWSPGNAANSLPLGSIASIRSGGVTTVHPLATRRCKLAYRDVDFGFGSNEAILAACGASIDLFHPERRKPVASLTTGADTSTCVRFNPAETGLLASCGSDRAVALHDTRQASQLRRVLLLARPNAVSWNPREPFNFVAACEDANLYTFDMRKLSSALTVHRDFVSSVLDVDFSPQGTEFAAGAFDRTVRIFGKADWQSREVYHTKRMQRVSCVRYSGDASYIVTASEEGNARLWKADASAQTGTLLPQEKKKRAYERALVKRYAHVPTVRKVSRQRLVPRAIHKAHRKRKAMEQSESRKRENLRRHSKPGEVPHKAMRQEHIAGQEE